jgi:hypothetical protein
MKTSPLHLARARNLLLPQPPIFSVNRRQDGSKAKRHTFVIRILRSDAPLRLLPQLGPAVRGKGALPA